MTQSSFDEPCTPLYGGADTGLYVLSICLTPHVFSYVFVPRSVPVTLGTPDNELPSREFIVEDVRSLYTDLPHMMVLTGLLIGSLLGGPHLDTLSAGCKQTDQPLWPGDGICSEPWARGQQQLVRRLPGKGVGRRPSVEGIQRYGVLVGFIYNSLSTWTSART